MDGGRSKAFFQNPLNTWPIGNLGTRGSQPACNCYVFVAITTASKLYQAAP